MLRQQIDERVRPFLSGRNARIIPPANFHITLAFLGAVGEENLPQVIEAADQVKSEAFEVTLAQLELWKNSQLACLAITPTPPPLRALVDRLRINLLARNVQADQKEFKGHVTIAREWQDKSLDTQIEPLIWTADEFVLVESKSRHTGSEYSVVGRWPLMSRMHD